MEPQLLVINEQEAKKSDGESVESSVLLSQKIGKLIKRVKGAHMSEDGTIDYTALKASDLYTEYVQESGRLSLIRLEELSERQKKAFFINVYNALTIHGVMARETLPESVLKINKFWKVTAYRIGPHTFSLDDIEHGILRGNKAHPTSQSLQFEEGDPRVQLAMKELDPRIHMALNCGAKSCPMVNVYSEENLDVALDAAARSFCEQEIAVLPKCKEVIASRIFQWYFTDFGADDVQALKWTLPYLSEEKSRTLRLLLTILESDGGVAITYNEYDWSLNAVDEAGIPPQIARGKKISSQLMSSM